MNARHLTGLLHDLLEPRHRQPASFRVEGPELAGRAFRGDGPHDVTTVAHSSPSSRAAERLRLALIEGAARLQDDAGVFTSPVEALPMPAELAACPGTLLTWVTHSPYEERRWVGGYVRRGRVTWEVLASGARDLPLDDFVVQVVNDLISREPEMEHGSLWDLLPLPAELPGPMVHEASLGSDPQVEQMLEAA
jgi:hypothetical protein